MSDMGDIDEQFNQIVNGSAEVSEPRLAKSLPVIGATLALAIVITLANVALFAFGGANPPWVNGFIALAMGLWSVQLWMNFVAEQRFQRILEGDHPTEHRAES